MRVLVVEDEVRLAATLQDLLELNGYTVDVCHDGEAGLDNALTSIYDVILLDVMLPKLDGFTVAAPASGRSGSTTPVLMLTARSDLDGPGDTGWTPARTTTSPSPLSPRSCWPASGP